MNAYLNSQGYYYAVFSDSVKVDTVADQLRANVSCIDVGKNITIDSVSYNLGDTTLQKLTERMKKKIPFLKKGSPYTKEGPSVPN
jgi:outer membrane protein insertion porin family